MNFFEHQHQARATSRRLVLLFVAAVIGVVLVVNLVAAAASGVSLGWLDWNVHLWVTLATVALIAAGATLESLKLREGGDAVARMLGARAVDPGTADHLERRLLNVVEEMALASGVPVPRVYLMDNEPAINAFAAGHTLNDAVVAVTRGTLTRLSRDELQGVVAHEFSHVLHGDMRLNMRLIAAIFGLTMVATAGRFLMEMAQDTRDRKAVSALAVAGLGLLATGYVGVLFGRMIKAGVSRQREYLADASAVQFTRNPDGIGGALRKIGGLAGRSARGDGQVALATGSDLHHPHAETVAHLLLGPPHLAGARGLLATHPPLAERIRRIYGRSMSVLEATEAPLTLWPDAQGTPGRDGTPARRPDAGPGISPLEAFRGIAPTLTESIGMAAAQPQARSYATSLRDAVHRLGLAPTLTDTGHAQVLVLAMLIDEGGAVDEAARSEVAATLGTQAADGLQPLHAALQKLPPGTRLPILDLAMPALRKLPLGEGERLITLARGLIAADGRMTLPEFLLLTTLERRLGADAAQPVRPRYPSVGALPQDAARILSLIAHLRTSCPPIQAFAAGKALLPGVDLTLQPTATLTAAALSGSLDHLNRMMPLAKPAFIKACAAAALEEGSDSLDWRALSALRTVCAALDAPLPPMLDAVTDRMMLA